MWGFGAHAVVETLLARVPKELRCGLPLRDYAAIRMAEGLVAMSHEDADDAIGHFDAVLAFERDLDDFELLAIANFWKARSQQKEGRVRRGPGACGQGPRSRPRLRFRTHGRGDARPRELAVLSEGQTQGSTEDSGRDGIRCSARPMTGWSWETFSRPTAASTGRRAGTIRRSGISTTPSASTGSSITSIPTWRGPWRIWPTSRGWWRSTCDERSIRNWRGAGTLVRIPRPAPNNPRRDIATSSTRLRDAAFEHLDEAAAIYGVHPNHRGEGTVHLNRGLLHLDNGALDLAEEEAARAFALGEEKEDAILMSRARILQCMVENAKLEEGIEEDPRRHAQAALDYVRDAIEFARTTQNRRLLARAHTWHGLTLSNEFFGDHHDAGEAMNIASTYLDHGFHDTAWEDLRTLKARVTGSHSVDETLLAWSQGEVGNRTFRQISDQFAEIIIPRVWEIEGRKIARVATRLSISPKKVRRALTRAGLLRSQTQRETAPEGEEASPGAD